MKIVLFSFLVLVSGFGVAFANPVTTEVSSEIKTHFVDEQIMIMADISNNQDIPIDRYHVAMADYNYLYRVLCHR